MRSKFFNETTNHFNTEIRISDLFTILEQALRDRQLTREETNPLSKLEQRDADLADAYRTQIKRSILKHERHFQKIPKTVNGLSLDRQIIVILNQVEDHNYRNIAAVDEVIDILLADACSINDSTLPLCSKLISQVRAQSQFSAVNQHIEMLPDLPSYQ